MIERKTVGKKLTSNVTNSLLNHLQRSLFVKMLEIFFLAGWRRVVRRVVRGGRRVVRRVVRKGRRVVRRVVRTGRRVVRRVVRTGKRLGKRIYRTGKRLVRRLIRLFSNCGMAKYYRRGKHVAAEKSSGKHLVTSHWFLW